MKRLIVMCVAMLAIVQVATAQKQKVTVGKEGEMIVNGDTVAYIEREGCKLLSNVCMFTITDENDDLLMTIKQESFNDKDYITREFPNGTPTLYLVFSFKGYEGVAETDSPVTPKMESVAKIIARWRLIKDHRLDPEAVQQFVAANGTKFSDKERQQNQSPAIIIIQQ